MLLTFCNFFFKKHVSRKHQGLHGQLTFSVQSTNVSSLRCRHLPWTFVAIMGGYWLSFAQATFYHYHYNFPSISRVTALIYSRGDAAKAWLLTKGTRTELDSYCYESTEEERPAAWGGNKKEEAKQEVMAGIWESV